MNSKKFETELAGKKLIIETGKLANQTNASVTCQYGDTVVLATVVLEDMPRDGVSFFPLMVDFEEKMYAAGKIKGSRFIKRETRPSDEAVLSARMIDRAIRPLFPQDIKNDIQVILSILSVDQENDPDIPSFYATAAALAISNIPWDGPVSAMRVGQIDGELVLNPTYEAREKSALDLVVAGFAQKVIMLEAGANEVDEKTIYEAIQLGSKHNGKILNFIEDIVKQVGKEKISIQEFKEDLEESIESDDEKFEESKGKKSEQDEWEKITFSFLEKNIDKYLFTGPKKSKKERKDAVGEMKSKLEEHLLEKQIGKEKRQAASGLLESFIEEKITEAIVKKSKRVDGRALDEIRALSSEAGLLPRTHGSGLFNRGETQVLSIVTLGSPGDEQVLDTMEQDCKKRYMHHYNFPPFSVGEVKPLRGASRRDIGHGALAEKALEPVLPLKQDFPYTIRVVSEVLGSNGSSSMGSVCGSTLALMDAGVPIKKPVAGIAMGLASIENNKNDITDYKIITDIQDLEDGKGGMDFKVASTADGITAIQLDTKTHGITFDIVQETLKRAKTACLEILKVIAKAIPEPRKELSQYAPKITTVKIDPEKIRIVIGPGGKMINEIIDACGVDIDIEDSGLVMITGIDPEKTKEAIAWVKALTRELKPGEKFQGKITRIEDFGAFVELILPEDEAKHAPKFEGLIHISKLAPHRIDRVEDVVKFGEIVPVEVEEIDEKGRLNLKMQGVQAAPAQRHQDFHPSSNNRGRFSTSSSPGSRTARPRDNRFPRRNSNSRDFKAFRPDRNRNSNRRDGRGDNQRDDRRKRY
ncbi:polyribonucleotide nucleotidyltransferase [Patescibacteria group bacterium]|nr:polyribonucleotide nucleotidyltransferase [Patescibacteria group bacterium]MBU4512332.1 polyribonucleotide nucleotidyltransferase [Patescibacteria group bacterium]MCG2692547.1 polyribonucleotide nucleotidyltransferase [Candidatus Parcubacteria bacterium]